MVTASVQQAAIHAPKASPQRSRVIPAPVVHARLARLMREVQQMGLGQFLRGIDRVASVVKDSDRRPGT